MSYTNFKLTSLPHSEIIKCCLQHVQPFLHLFIVRRLELPDRVVICVIVIDHEHVIFVFAIIALKHTQRRALLQLHRVLLLRVTMPETLHPPLRRYGHLVPLVVRPLVLPVGEIPVLEHYKPLHRFARYIILFLDLECKVASLALSNEPKGSLNDLYFSCVCVLTISFYWNYCVFFTLMIQWILYDPIFLDILAPHLLNDILQVSLRSACDHKVLPVNVCLDNQSLFG